MKAIDELNEAMDDLYDVYLGLDTRDYNLTVEEWDEVGDIAADLHKVVSTMAGYLQKVINRYDK